MLVAELEGLHSSNPRGASTNNHHLAIPPYPKQGLDLDIFDYNDSTPLRSHFFYPSHLSFYHHWYIPVLEVVCDVRNQGPQ